MRNRRRSCDPTVHPRVRGEHLASLGATENAAGSSPRARGILDTSPSDNRFPRFIPACAGNTLPGGGCRRRTPVHPRVRGEHASPRSMSRCAPGSSPRARGTRPRCLCGDARDRFIPACAGNTPTPAHSELTSAVHPRVRGEHDSRAMALRTSSGSSPRARGTRAADVSHWGKVRFIPACAGNTVYCGRQSTKPGSSPRARGTPSNDAFGGAENRFIPACAGNTIVGSPTKALNSVHPRVRGEHFPRSAAIWLRIGSSPRARGTLWAQARTP